MLSFFVPMSLGYIGLHASILSAENEMKLHPLTQQWALSCFFVNNNSLIVSYKSPCENDHNSILYKNSLIQKLILLYNAKIHL